MKQKVSNSVLEDRKKQYAICQERGHVAVSIANSPIGRETWGICKFCGTNFRFVEVLEERNKP